MEEFVTSNSKQTKQLGEMLAKEIRGGEIICLQGDLGAGKTTFTQGFLKGLGVQGPYTSPTFLIMKEYKRNARAVKKIYHIDAYRVESQDMLNLGWEEMVKSAQEKKDSVVVVEWADRIKKIIPSDAVWLEFVWVDNKKRIIRTIDYH